MPVLGRYQTKHMTEKYKVRGAMLALREFTVEDLARHSGVNPRTIHTELIRAGDLVEKLPPADGPKARGGQPLRYRVRAPRLPDLRRELESTFSALSQAIEPVLPEAPLSLQVAEDTLAHVAGASAADRPHMLQMAGLQLRAAERQIAAFATASAHREIVDQLRQRIAAARRRLGAEEPASRFPAGVVLVDAAGGRLLQNITEVVDLADVVSMGVWSALRRREIEQEVQGLAHALVIVALDSARSEMTRRRILADAVIKAAAEPGRSMFLDAGYDEKLRNYVLEHACFYVGEANSLKLTALRGLVHAWQFGHAVEAPSPAASSRPKSLTAHAARR